MNNIPNLNDMLKLYTKKDLWGRIQHHIKRIDNLQSQLDQQKAMWKELKEILKRQIDIDSKEYLESGFVIFKNYLSVERFIINKMEELEGEDVED